MKLLCFFMLLFSLAMGAQTYPKYVTQKTKDTVAVTAEKKAKAQPVKSAAQKETTEEFQALMNKGGEHTVEQNHKEAIKYYTRALKASTEDTAWRALISRATEYEAINNFDKAIADYTAILENESTPAKQVAIVYFLRAKAASQNKDRELACSDLKKARALGYPVNTNFGLKCD